jgi:hypothetical protein
LNMRAGATSRPSSSRRIAQAPAARTPVMRAVVPRSWSTLQTVLPGRGSLKRFSSDTGTTRIGCNHLRSIRISRMWHACTGCQMQAQVCIPFLMKAGLWALAKRHTGKNKAKGLPGCDRAPAKPHCFCCNPLHECFPMMLSAGCQPACCPLPQVLRTTTSWWVRVARSCRATRLVPQPSRSAGVTRWAQPPSGHLPLPRRVLIMIMQQCVMVCIRAVLLPGSTVFQPSKVLQHALPVVCTAPPVLP